MHNSLNNSSDICSICLDIPTSIIKLDNCSHTFCKGCITRWKKINKICPLCRTPFNKIEKLTNFSNINFQIKKRCQNNQGLLSEKQKLKSHKLCDISFCNICQKYDNTASIFTCQICKKYRSHFLCENPVNFQLGIYLCSSCNDLRKKRLNEN